MQEVDRAVCRGDIPAYGRLLLHIVAQKPPKGLAEDHVLEVGDFGEDFLRKGVRYGTHEQGVFGLPVDDALEDVVFFDSNRHEEKLRREFPS